MPGGRPRKPPGEKAQATSMKVPPAIVAALLRCAEAEGLSMSAVAVRAMLRDMRALGYLPHDQPPQT